MHLNECLRLAFAPPSADTQGQGEEGAAPNAYDYPESNLSFLADSSHSQTQQPQLKQHAQGSALSAVKCIASEWLSKSQTNFYIPPEHYAGYSYLIDDGDGTHSESEWHSVHQNPHSHAHAQHHRALVYAAEGPNNLHPHHYDVYKHNATGRMTLTAMHSPINLTVLASDPIHSSILASKSANVHHGPVTVPYIHPHLELPVPPLQLPVYFGALCWSFTLGGLLMLCLTPKWVLCGGAFVYGDKKERGGHWFPYHAFAWALILCQGPCSFMADYIHMTNNSPWHAIDRFLACFLMSLAVVKLHVMRPYTRPAIYVLELICCGMALFCFMRSQQSQQSLDEDGFVFWHCGWHCYPVTGGIVHLLDNFLSRRWGEYYEFECKEEGTRETSEGGGILSSSIDTTECLSNTEGKGAEVKSEPPICNHTPKRAKAKRVTRSGRETSPTLKCASAMTPPSVRRSRRVAGKTPELQSSL